MRPGPRASSAIRSGEAGPTDGFRWSACLPLVAAAALLASACARVTAPQRAICSGASDSILPLSAQAVPSATYLPCVQTLPAGWTYGGADVRSGSARFWLDSDRAGAHAVEVTLTTGCDLSGFVEVPADPGQPADVRAYEEPAGDAASPADRRSVFPGGCVTVEFGPAGASSQALASQIDPDVRLLPRSVVVDRVRRETGLTLCGAEAPPCRG